MYGIKRKHTFLGSIYRNLEKYAPRVVLAIAILVGSFIAYIIYTAPAPFMEDEPVDISNICIYDSPPSNSEIYKSSIDYKELFPEGYEFGKDGEILTDDEDIAELLPLAVGNPLIGNRDTYYSTPDSPMTINSRFMYAAPFILNGTKHESCVVVSNEQQTAEVPEPSTIYLVLLAQIFIFILRRKS